MLKQLLLAMALVATLKTSGQASPGTASWATSAFTPASGSLIVAFVFVVDNSAGDIAANLTISDGTNTYTARVTEGRSGVFQAQGRCWTAPNAVSASRTITFDCGASNVISSTWFIYEVTGYDTGTPTGAAASDAETMAFDGAGSLTLSGAPLATSVVLAGVGVDGDSSGTIAVTPGAGWTENGEAGNTTVAAYGQVQQRTGSTSTAVAWVDVRAGTMATFSACGIALEIKVPVAPSAVLSGTVTSSITENDIVAGGKTIVLTVANTTWVP